MTAPYAITIPNFGTISIDGSTVTVSQSSGSAAKTDTVTPMDYFPADPTQAPVSPENSEIMLFGGKVVGPAYLKDKNGSLYTLVLDTNGDGNAYAYINGSTKADTNPVTVLLVRQSNVYFQVSTGQWQVFNPAMGSSYNTSLPPANTSVSSTGVAVPAMPALPTPSAIAPGSSGKIINCGTGQALATLSAGIAAASAGDTVVLAPGTYNEAPPSINVPILLNLGTATVDGTGLTASLAGGGLGLIVPNADIIIQGGTITGAAMDQTSAQMTSGIRPNGKCGYLTIKGTTFTKNQVGLGVGFPVVVKVSDATFTDNGLGDESGATHNMYVNGISLELDNVTSIINPTATGPLGLLQGHAVKTRSNSLSITGGTFQASHATPIDIPNGSTTQVTITNATINKTAADDNHGVLGYGMEGPTNGLAGVAITGGTINALCPSPIWQGEGGTLTLSKVTINGGPIVAQGITVTGA